MTYRTFDGTSQVEAITNGRFSSDGTQYLKDSETINVGTSSDLKILHDGSNSIISDEGTGQLKIQTNGANIQLNKGTTENMIVARTDGSVDLYHDNSKKLETSSTGITVTGNVVLGDSSYVNLGSGTDLQLYHDTTNSYLRNATGELRIKSNTIKWVNDANDETYASGVNGGAVELYYDNVKKFETNADGTLTQGTIQVDGAEGGTAQIRIHADEGDDNADKWRLISNTDGTFERENYASGSYEVNMKATGNGNIELYYDNSKRIETTSNGVTVTGELQGTGDLHLNNGTNSGKDVKFVAASDTFRIYDDVNLTCGTGDDLSIHHDGTDSYINNTTGYLYLNSGTSAIRFISDGSWADGSMAAFYRNAAVELYYDNAKKIETASWGVQISGDARPASDDSTDLGTTGARWDDVYATNGTIQTSDRNQKNTIVTSDLGLPFINKLKPVSYKFNGKTRTHYGLISQDVETVLSDISKATSEFAGFIKEDDSYGLRYNEFIAPLIKAVQELSAKVTALENA